MTTSTDSTSTDSAQATAPAEPVDSAAPAPAAQTPPEPVHDAAVTATESRVEAIDEAADETTPATASDRVKKARYRSVLVFGGALLIGGLLAPLVIVPRNSEPVAASQLTWQMAMPASSTTVLTSSAAPGRAMSGVISPVADITGRAPTSGEIARWVVRIGARVEAGAPVVQITSGPSTRAPLPGETKQIVAEKQQNAAADDQLALAQKLSATQAKLQAAGERVTRAQDKISASRALIQRLRAGETVPAEAPALPAPVPKTRAKTGAQLVAARAKTADAQRQVAGTIGKLAQARADLSGAQKSLPALQSKVDDAAKNASDIETKFDGSLTNAADLQAARVAQSNARNTLKVATARADTAQKAIPDLEKQLAQRQSAVDAARATQTKLAANDLAQDDAPAPAQTGAPRGAPRPALSIEAAVKGANDALAESRAAAREVDRMHALVAQYQAQAQSSNAQIESATKVLETAQTAPLVTVPQVRFTAANAPAAGVVVWVARLAREVGAGQSVFGLSSGKKFVARFEDKTDNWKNARVGQTVSALIAPPAPKAEAPSVPNSQAKAMPALVAPSQAVAPPKAVAPLQTGVIVPVAAPTPSPILSAATAGELGATPVSVKLTRIAPPERAGEAAIIEGEIVGGASNAGPNWQLLASLPDPSQPTITTVPSAALVQRGADTYVAVLEPVAAPADPKNAEAKTQVAPAPEIYQLQWQKVSVAPQDGVSNRVQSGLRAGQRVVTDPLPLLAQAPPSAPALPQVKLSAT